MADPLRQRTERLVADYLEYCSREPGTPESPPSTAEAAVLRAVAASVRKLYRSFFSAYLGYPGNRVELVARMAEALLSDSPGPTWGNVVMLLAFAGTLLERGPLVTARWKKWGFQSRLKEPEGDVARDCQRLVALLSLRLVGQHRAWLEAQGGWVSTERDTGRDRQLGTAGPRAGHEEGPTASGPWNEKGSFRRDWNVRCEVWDFSSLGRKIGRNRPC
ncbi:hypothetical protein P7K49_017566 [Saguinus oedipus]|uniref:Bcl-2 Bcl-2 homology region 1-3 domain-containing protein n=1 Tax=Saguinus oedipus TaxID=9490 RepID=A0ABQ9V3V0_SAGOE|nr:hypothetical protein P7K49_017566 [Saguinus oedipus]